MEDKKEIGNYEPDKIETNILEFWDKNKIYEKAKQKNKNGKKFYFLDGPPYTSGKVHIGTAWNKVLKDSVLRYKRMNGFDVYDRAGYDMHGLPTANAVMKKLGIKNKDEILKFGLKKFIQECKNFSIENMNKMTKDFIRLGVWMDFENAYQPIKKEFIEGVWFLIKKAEENKRLYEGEKTMHWCASCQTALAKHELEYKTVKDKSIFLRFKVKDKEDEYLIVWTTTPWTIPFNLGVMVNPDLEYVKVKVNWKNKPQYWIVAKGLVGPFISGVLNMKFEIVEEFKGEKLNGLEYIHPLEKELKDVFDEIRKKSKIHRVVMSSEYVDLSAGTGLVHMAPGCGPEDYEVGHREGIPPFNNLKEDGTFPDEMGIFSGLRAKKDDDKFIKALDDVGSLIAETEVEHDYPFCWRCKNPVIFRTTKQWFFKIEDLVDEMRELNKKVKWVPDWAGSNWFDSWLKNLRDNNITRQRYWGTPVPIWKCDKCGKYDVISSLDELKQKSGKEPKDMHIPWIDEITYKCECGGTKKRVPDILDVWIDAGTTSWTALDYPKNKELFKELWPADFILEGKDQIRGWFNLLLIASMISFKKHPYKAVYMHGMINDVKGRKMSKSLGNYILPEEVIEKYGADTFRYYAIGGANPGIDLNYNFEDMKVKYRNLVVLWNIHKYLIELSQEVENPEETTIEKIKKELDIEEKYILSKLNSTKKEVKELFDEYKLNEIPLKIEELFLELSRTYIHWIREKFTYGSNKEKEKIVHVIYSVLIDILKMFSTISPMATEQMYQNLKPIFNLKQESLMLYDWPEHDESMIDKKIEESAEIAKSMIQSILSARETAKKGIRWPLKEAYAVTDEETKEMIEPFKEIIKTRTNIKELIIVNSFDKSKTKVKLDYSKIEPVYGPEKSAKIVAKLSMHPSETIIYHINKEGKFVIDVDGEKVEIKNEHLIKEREAEKPYIFSEFKKGEIYLNSAIDDELEAEGYANELMRRIQSMRKKQNLKKKDSITLFIKTEEETAKSLEKYQQKIKERVGASQLKISSLEPSKQHDVVEKIKIKNMEFTIMFTKE